MPDVWPSVCASESFKDRWERGARFARFCDCLDSPVSMSILSVRADELFFLCRDRLVLVDDDPFAARLAQPVHTGLRLNLRYGEPVTDPLVPDLWRRELARAATHTSLGYPPMQGLI